MNTLLPYQGLLYKEWIKLRYLGLLPFALLLLALGESFYSMNNLHAASGGQSLWTQVLFRSRMYFERMQYLPLFTGIWLAGVQFLPECLNKRLRLFFHLPVHEQKALVLMLGTGFALLLGFSALFCVVQTHIVSRFLPTEVAQLTVQTILPLCLSGFVAYLATVLVLIEQRPWRRCWHAMLGYVLATALCNLNGYGRYVDNLPVFALLALALLLGLPGVLDRIRRGLTW